MIKYKYKTNFHFLQLQQQVGPISSSTPLGYQNPESPSHGQVFSTETFERADINSEVDGDKNLMKYPHISDTKKQNTWSQLFRLLSYG